MDARQLSGLWSPMFVRLHINILELVAVYLAIKKFRLLRGTHVRLHSDNTTIVYCLNRGNSARSRPLNSWVLSIQLSLREQGSLSQCVSCVRDTQCDYRRFVSQESSELRMVVGRRLLSMDLSVGGSPGGGLVRYSGEQQASKICVTSSRSIGSAQGRVHHRLEQVGKDLSFSALDTNFEGSVSTSFIQGSSGPDCSSLASPVLVSTASVSGQIIPQNPQPLPHPEGGGSDLLDFCKSQPPPSRLDFLRKVMEGHFVRESVDVWLDTVRESSQKQYKSTGLRFWHSLVRRMSESSTAGCCCL